MLSAVCPTRCGLTFTRPRAWAVACVCVCLAAPVGGGVAPGPVLPPGDEVDVPEGWSVDDEPGVRDADGNTPFPTGAERMNAAPVRLVPGHAYRVSVPVRMKGYTAVRAGIQCDREEQLFWPKWSGGDPVKPDDLLTGILVAIPGRDVGRLFVDRSDDGVQVVLGDARVQDLGPVRGESPGRLFHCTFEHWDAAGRPACVAAVAFAAAGQFGPSDNAPAGGKLCAYNAGGRAMLFGHNRECRFGTILQARLAVRGSGSVTLSLEPFLHLGQRGMPPSTVSVQVQSDEWETLELTVPQNNPSADRFRFVADIRGAVYLDELTFDVLDPE